VSRCLSLRAASPAVRSRSLLLIPSPFHLPQALLYVQYAVADASLPCIKKQFLNARERILRVTFGSRSLLLHAVRDVLLSAPEPAEPPVHRAACCCLLCEMCCGGD